MLPWNTPPGYIPGNPGAPIPVPIQRSPFWAGSQGPVSYLQITAPTNIPPGTLWIDTANGNTYRWNGLSFDDTGIGRGLSNPLTAAGDLVYNSATLIASALHIGTAGQVLTVVGGLPAWANPVFVPSGSITLSGYTENTGRLLGRTTAGVGAIEEITPSAVNFIFLAGALNTVQDIATTSIPTFKGVIGSRTDGGYQYTLASASRSYGLAVSGTTFLLDDLTAGATRMSFTAAGAPSLSFLTTNGPVVATSGTGLLSTLAPGVNGTFLGVSGGVLGFFAPSGSGTVNTGTLGQMAFYAAAGNAVSGTDVVKVSAAGALTLAATAQASPRSDYYLFRMPNDSGQTASTEAIGWEFIGGQRTYANGNFALQREIVFGSGPITYAFVSGSNTIATAVTLALLAPQAGAHGAITHAYGLQVDAAQVTSNLDFLNNFIASIGLTAQTVGNVALAIPDFAGVADTFVFNTRAATLANKTLTAPIINGATSASGNFDLSGSAGTFKTSSGAATFNGSSNVFANALTPAQVAGIVGTTTNNNANAGAIGEVISSSISSGSAVALTTTASINVTSIALTAGDWDVWGVVWYSQGSGTTATQYRSSISATNNTVDFAVDGFTQAKTQITVFGGDANQVLTTRRVLLAGPATYYLVAESDFAVSTMAAYGAIFARRRR